MKIREAEYVQMDVDETDDSACLFFGFLPRAMRCQFASLSLECVVVAVGLVAGEAMIFA